MSFVADQIRRIDAHLDRIQLSQDDAVATLAASRDSPGLTTQAEQRIARLQSLIKTLSTSPGTRDPVLPQNLLKYSLNHAALIIRQHPTGPRDAAYEEQLCLLLAYKATVQVYGLVLRRLLDDTVALADESWYWDGVLGTRFGTAYYGVQTLPVRVFNWLRTVWHDIQQKRRAGSITSSSRDAVTSTWHDFYRLVSQAVRERRVIDMRSSVLGPVARLRSEVRRKQDKLRAARTRGANSLGVLVNEGLLSMSLDDPSASPMSTSMDGWKSVMARSGETMARVLSEKSPADLDASAPRSADQVLSTLARLLDTDIPAHSSRVSSSMYAHGRPSAVIRYWPAAAAAILSSSTVLRILVNRKAEILTWIGDLGATIMDFWHNWILEPTRKVIATIRHDEGSAVSIMSKRSLQGDRESLERMVVDFAIDNPADVSSSGSPLTASEIEAVRLRVREGDLTPVLKAYEQDLAKPLAGSLRGNLIRTLLIQVQKSKVDIEVAIGGIDALLKSQELVFGFVGLTPGLLVTILLFRWLRDVSMGRKSLRRDREQGVMVRQLRNIDRLLCESGDEAGASSSSSDPSRGRLDYKSYGLLLCEVHVLSQRMRRIMPDEVYREFSQDLEQLLLPSVRSGIERQSRVVQRIRWAYAQWL